MCGWGGGGTRVGDAGAGALGRELGGGRGALKRLKLDSGSLCVLPDAVLGSVPWVPAGMTLAAGGACACGVEGVCGALGC